MSSQGGRAAPAVTMSGTEAQVEWAGRIRRQVNTEFDRVAAAFRSIAARQRPARRADTDATIAILEDKRAEVMSRGQAGYFIHDWQEISDQVRQMILHDDRYQAIRNNRAARRPIAS
jgi:hypothetical protein